MRTEELSYLFKNLKNGDCFSFYHKKWYFLFSRLIFWITRDKEDHDACVFDVKKSFNVISFKVGEQLTSGRIVTEYIIERIVAYGITKYYIDSRFRKKSVYFYYHKNKSEISSEQNNILAEYWAKKISYEFSQLPFTINWIYKLFGNKNKVYDRNCSTAFAESMKLIGFTDFDAASTPAEVASSLYFEPIILIDPR